MPKSNHLSLVVNNTVGTKENEKNLYYDVSKVLNALNTNTQALPLKPMLRDCVAFGSECPGHGYWEFVDNHIAYFDFLFDGLLHNQEYESNLEKINFFVQLVYLSFLARIDSAERVKETITPFLSNLPLNLQNLVSYHSMMLAETSKDSHQDMPVSGEPFALVAVYANRTSDVLSR